MGQTTHGISQVWTTRPMHQARWDPDYVAMTTQRVETSEQDELIRLIQHGRDREAANLATTVVAESTGGADDPRRQLDEIVPLLTALVVPLTDAQLDAPTACAQLTVRGVVEHMIAGATQFAAVFRGRVPTPPPADTDLVASFAVAMANLRSAVHSPGAMDRAVTCPVAAMRTDVLARFLVMAALVHGRDIATATGQPFDPPVYAHRRVG